MAEEQKTEEIVPLAEESPQPASSTSALGIPSHVHDGVQSPRNHVRYTINDSRARAYRNTNETKSVGAPRRVSLDTESYDTLNQFDNTASSTPYRFTVKLSEAGYYLMLAGIIITPFAAGDVYQLILRVNNSDVARIHQEANSTGSNSVGITVTDIRKLAVGDYVDLFIDSSGGGDYTVIGGATKTYLTIHRIS